MPRQKYLLTIILITFALETLSTTWFLKFPGLTPFFSILYFVSGLAFAFLLLFFPAVKIPGRHWSTWNTHVNHYRLIIIGLIALAMYSWCKYWFEEIPIDISNADMLPIIKVMGDRFVAGHHRQVYDTIPWIWNGIQPIYLPAMWLPYVPAIALGIDIRWITMAGLLFVFSIFLFVYRPNTHRYLSFFTGVLAFLLFWWILADNTPGIISVSEEGVVIAYYVLLVLALISGNPWFIGITASLCMLSRYSLIGWIPAYLLHLVLEKKWKSIFIVSLTGILCFVLLFLLPVGWQTFMRLARLPGNYIPFAGRVWHDSPDVFSSSPGLAIFFGPKRIPLLHHTLILLSFAVPFLFVLLCDWIRHKARAGIRPEARPGIRPKTRSAAHQEIDQETQPAIRAGTRPGKSAGPIANIPLAALKLSLVIFYCFIDVPYLYLFYTSSFVSLMVLVLLIRKDDPLTVVKPG